MSDKGIKVLTESFEITKEEDEGVKMEGFALPFHEKSRNGVIYDKESVEQTADTLIGKSILYNHNDMEYPVGHVKDVEVKDDGLYYEANLDPNEEKLITKLKRGDINSVSVQVAVNEEEFEGDKVKVKDFWELSVCPIAGYPQTNTSIEKLLKQKNQNQENSEVSNMKEDKEPKETEEQPEETEETEEEQKEEVEDIEEKLETLETEIQELKERISNLEAKLEAEEQKEEDKDEEDEEEEKDKEPEEEEEENKEKTKTLTKEELEQAKSKRTLTDKDDVNEEDAFKKALREVI